MFEHDCRYKYVTARVISLLFAFGTAWCYKKNSAFWELSLFSLRLEDSSLMSVFSTELGSGHIYLSLAFKLFYSGGSVKQLAWLSPN